MSSIAPTSQAAASAQAGASLAPRDSHSLAELVRGLLRRWWIAVLALALGGAGAMVYSLRLPVVYTAAATVEILRAAPMVMPIVDVIPTEVMSSEDLNTQVAWLGSRAIAERVASRLGPGELRRLVEPYPELSGGDLLSDAIEVLDQQRRVVPLRMSLVVAAVFEHPDRDLTPRVANLFAEEFIALKISTKTTEAFRVADELKAKAEQQRKVVEQLSAAMQEYKERQDLVSLDARRDIVTAGLRETNARVSALAARFAEAETRWKRVADARAAGTALTDLAEIAADARVAAMQAGVAERKIALAQLHNRYRPKHPSILAAETGLAAAERELDRAVALAAMALEADVTAARDALGSARVEFAGFEKESLRLQRLAIEFEALRRELAAAERLFNTILGRMSETTLTGAIEVTNARIVDRATPAAPVGWTRHLKPVALGIFGGAAFGCFLAFVLALADSRVRSRDALARVTGLELVAEIPDLPRKAGAAARARWLEREPRSVAAEAVRALYCGLRARSMEAPGKVLVVTSAVGGEGKSLVAANLARCCGLYGERTLLIDADLRRPAQHALAEIKAEPTGGLQSLSAEPRVLSELIRPAIGPNLDLLPAGARVPNPAPILGGAAFADLLREARKSYDRVVIDTPPAAGVGDAALVLAASDGCVLVAGRGTKRKLIQCAMDRTSQTNTVLFAAVLNRSRSKPVARSYFVETARVALQATGAPSAGG